MSNKRTARSKDRSDEYREQVETMQAEAHDAVADFDAFWQSRKRTPKPVRIMGEVVELPPSLPLQFEMEARRLQRSKKDDDVRKLVAILFGEDMTGRWAERGMDIEQFQVLLAWAPRYIAGQNTSIEQVADELATEMAKQEGADPT